jgi:UvrB/uvrC motif
MAEQEDIDQVLRAWEYDAEGVNVRLCAGSDGRTLLQMRLDLGILQLEISGRPDGLRPGGKTNYLEHLVEHARRLGDEMLLTNEQCAEIDREFLQYYHRRICWLQIREFANAVADADHTLALMDLAKKYSPDEQWTLSHEQYRPVVIYHRTQALALQLLKDSGVAAAVEEVNGGLAKLREFHEEYAPEEDFEELEIVTRLTELRESFRQRFRTELTLAEQLAEAVAAEKYELAASLRDELAKRNEDSAPN